MTFDEILTGYRDGLFTEDELFGWLTSVLLGEPERVAEALVALDFDVDLREGFRAWLKHLRAETEVLHQDHIFRPTPALLQAIASTSPGAKVVAADEVLASLQEAIPDAEVSVDTPVDAARGSTWIDVTWGRKRFTVEYHPRHGLAVSLAGGTHYGGAPDARCGSVEEVVRWMGTERKRVFGRVQAARPVWSRSADATAAE